MAPRMKPQVFKTRRDVERYFSGDTEVLAFPGYWIVSAQVYSHLGLLLLPHLPPGSVPADTQRVKESPGARVRGFQRSWVDETSPGIKVP